MAPKTHVVRELVGACDVSVGCDAGVAGAGGADGTGCDGGTDGAGGTDTGVASAVPACETGASTPPASVTGGTLVGPDAAGVVGGVATGPDAVVCGAPRCMSSARVSSSLRMPRADSKRRSGSFSRQRRTMRPTSCGSEGFSVVTGTGVSRRMDVIVVISLSPLNGRPPVSIS